MLNRRKGYVLTLLILSVFLVCSPVSISQVNAQTTTINNLQYPSQVVLQNGVVQVTVTFTLDYSGLPAGDGILMAVALGGWLYGSGSSAPDSCLSSWAGQSLAGYAVCVVTPGSNSGSESVTLTVKSSASPKQYTLMLGANMQDSSGSTVSGSATEQTLTINVVAGSGTDWAVASVSLNPPAPNAGEPVTFSTVITAISSPNPFPQDVQVGCMVDSTVVGSGSVSYPGPVNVPMTVSSQTPWTATPGPHTLTCAVATIPAGLDPDTSNNAMSVTFTVGSAPEQLFDFSISASPSTQTVTPGSSGSYTVNVNLISGTTQNVALTLTGAPGGVSGSFNPTSGTGTFTSTLTVTVDSSASSGTYPMTITGSGGGVTHQTTITLTVSQTSDFQINVNPSTQTVLQGQTVSYAVNVVSLNGFNSQVSLTVSGLPSGANGVFNVQSGTPDFTSTLTITLPGNVPTGSFTLTIAGSGGGISHVSNVLLTINQASQTETSTTQTATTSDLMGVLQQNSLLIISILLILVVAMAASTFKSRKPAGPTNQAAQPINVTYCPHCGAQNPIANQFCKKCGTKLG